MLQEPEAWQLFEQLRWSGAPDVCPHCSSVGRCYYLQPRNGQRLTRHGAPTPRRVWKCGACRGQFSVLTGTVLEGTRIPLARWFRAAQAICAGSAVLGPELGSAGARRHMEFVLAERLDLHELLAASPGGDEQTVQQVVRVDRLRPGAN